MKTIAISGVSRGIGAGVARAFLAAGWAVLGIGRSEPGWLSDFGPSFEFLSCDMADPVGVESACANFHRPLDVLLCNAASFGNSAFYADAFDPMAFMETMAINVVAPTVLARAFKANLAQRDTRLIVMMSTGNASLSGNREGSMLAYRASKSALNQVVRTLAAEWTTHGFTTVALNPGWVRTDMGGATAPTSVEEASAAILDFIMNVAGPSTNGGFVNTDGSELPW